jgi:hypothetical protein
MICKDPVSIFEPDSGSVLGCLCVDDIIIVLDIPSKRCPYLKRFKRDYVICDFLHPSLGIKSCALTMKDCQPWFEEIK